MVADSTSQTTIRQPVLVLLHGDGFVELFGTSDIDPVIVNVPVMMTQRGEIIAEQFVEAMLPPRHKQLFAPGNIRAAKLHRNITVEEIAGSIQDVTLLRTVDAIQGLLRQGVSF